MLKSLIRRVGIALLLWAMVRTGRVVRVNWHVVETLRRQGRGFLIGLWHNNILGLVDITGGERCGAMISRSRDGDDIAWVTERFGNRSLRGSTAAGATGALRQAMRMLAAGEPVVVTPDGPRGPRYVLKPGLVALARKTGAPIVPLAYSARRRHEFASWDRMKLPKLFAERVVLVGDPIWLDPAQADEAAHCRQVEAVLRELLRRAEDFTGASADFPDPLLTTGAAPPPTQA